MPQTRFVLKKGFFNTTSSPSSSSTRLTRADARPTEVLNEVFDLFVELEASDDALDFPVIYASGRAGYGRLDPNDTGMDMRPLMETICKKIPGPVADLEKPLQLQVTNIDYSEYVGRIGIGRIFNGLIKKDQQVALLKRNGKIEKHKIVDLYLFEGLGRAKTTHAEAGDICAVVGIDDVDIGDTIADLEKPEALPLIDVDEPTLNMIFSVNDSPFAGQDGKFITSRNVRERLYKELQSNVALRVEDTQRRPTRSASPVPAAGSSTSGVLIENMRREWLRTPGLQAQSHLQGTQWPQVRAD